MDINIQSFVRTPDKMPLASLRRLAVQVVLSAPTRLARDRYANASLILLGALRNIHNKKALVFLFFPKNYSLIQ
jgi:hypothetical protein